MATIFNGTVHGGSPGISTKVNYEYTRDGANMKYHFWGNTRLNSSNGWYTNNVRVKLYLNGSDIYTKNCKSSDKGWSIDWDAGWHTVSNKTSGTTPFYFTVKDTQNANWCNYTSSTYRLDVAPAYFTSTPTFTLTSRTETTATFSWSTPQTCSTVQYKINDGSWVDVVDDANSTSGSFTVSGLSANTHYTIYSDFKRKDSGLWAQTKPSKGVSTYAYPYLNSVPEFTVGNSLTIGIYNPLGRSCTISIIGDNGVEHNCGTIIGTTMSPFNDDSWKNIWYSTLPNKTQGTYKARLVCSTGNINQVSSAVKYYLDTSDSGFKPSFTANEIINVVNTANTAISGSNKFIKNHNSLSGVIKPMTAQRSASGSYYNVSTSGLATVKKDYSSSNINFVLGNMNNNSFNVTAVDSRGFTTTVSKTIDLVAYNSPGVTTSKITLQKGVDTKAVLSFKGVYTNWTGLLKTNSIQSIKYKIGSSGTWKSLPSNATFTSSNGVWTLNAVLDDTFATTSQYDLYLEIKDLLETVVVGSYTISTADAFIWKDLANKRMGINKKPTEALDVSGNVKCNYLYGKLTPQYFQDAIYGTAGSVNLYDRMYLDCINANRSAFFPGENVYIEHSTDGGSSWTEYTTSQFAVSSRKNLFSMTRAIGLPFGTVKPVTTNHRCRVTMKSPGSTWYCSLDRVFMFINTGGHTIKCDIEVSTYGAQTTYTKIISDYPLNGWSGPNMISFGNRSAWGTNSNGHVYNIRITFKITAVNTTYQNTQSSVLDIRFFGPNYWGGAGVPRHAGHLYNWDADQNVTFPATVNASKLKIDGTDVLLKVYPVGSIYISVNNTNPGTLFGGTWVQIKSAFLVGADGDKYVAGANGGSETHDHLYRVGYRPYYGALVGNDNKAIMLYDYRNRSWNYADSDTGLPDSNSINKALTKSENNIHAAEYSVVAHTDEANNIPPYLAVYMWKRTA